MDRQLLSELIEERFGTLRSVEKERPPTPYQISKRRRVLVGIDKKEAECR